MKKLIVLITVLLAGCSSNRVHLEPKLSNAQTVTYARGNVKINSQSELTILEYSSDKMVIGITVTNASESPILFSENNLSVEQLSEGEIQPATVYSFEQLAEEAADEGYGTAAQVGNTAASIGASFIPFGGIVYSVGRLFYSIGSQQSTESHEERVDKLAFAHLNKNYLRQQTIEPGANYSGVLKIGFEDDLEAGDMVVFNLSVGDGVEKFSLVCKREKEK